MKKTQLTWKKLLLLATIVGLYTGIVAQLPFLEDTSFQDIAISLERWILFGILIIHNSENAKDAALKCFVFFLLSQPLVYLVQVPFSKQGFGLFIYYRRWFIITLATLPMAYIGYNINKGNFISLIILLPMLLIDAYQLSAFTATCLYSFPYRLYSVIFCLITMFFYVILLFKKAKIRIIALIIVLVLSLGALATGFINRHHYEAVLFSSEEEISFDENASVSLKDPKYGSVSIELFDFGDETTPVVKANFIRSGKTQLLLTYNQQQYLFDLNIHNNSYELQRID